MGDETLWLDREHIRNLPSHGSQLVSHVRFVPAAPETA
jgi:hypothetical protein